MMGTLRKFISTELGAGLLACLSMVCVGAVAASRAPSGLEVPPEAVAGLYGACGNYTSTGPGCLGCYPGTGYASRGTITGGPTCVQIQAYACWGGLFGNAACGQYHWEVNCTQGM